MSVVLSMAGPTIGVQRFSKPIVLVLSSSSSSPLQNPRTQTHSVKTGYRLQELKMASSMALKRYSSLVMNKLLHPLPCFALVPRWFSSTNAPQIRGDSEDETEGPRDGGCYPFSYVLATHQMEVGKKVFNCDWSKSSTSRLLRPANDAHRYEILDLNSQIGNCIPLSDIRIGTWVHSIECKPGQGAKLAQAAGTYAKVIKEPGKHCLVRLPSGVEKLVDSRCRATIGVVSNPNHGARKLRKAGQSRWLGRRPVVRGVAMNPVDHPHGGGEGRTKGGRPSVSPWGKPTKAGFRTGAVKRKN